MLIKLPRCILIVYVDFLTRKKMHPIFLWHFVPTKEKFILEKKEKLHYRIKISVTPFLELFEFRHVVIALVSE